MQKIGDIQIFAEIKHGTHGATYRGIDTRSQEIVLVKTHRRARPETARNGSRFAQEAAVYAKIKHPNIVRLLEYGDTPSVQYLALEYIEGTDLRSLLDAHAPLPVDITLTIFSGLLDGLQALHRHRFVHRDLKPENILISQDGVVKICDFDLAVVATPETPNGISGSPGYLAPEMILGEPITPVADLFACGVLLYEMLTGARPFQMDTPAAEMNATVRMPHLPATRVKPDLPAVLDAFLDRLLAKKPAERITPAAARQWLQERFLLGSLEVRQQQLREFLLHPRDYAPTDILRPAATPPFRYGRRIGRHLPIAAALLVLFVALAYVFWPRNQVVEPNRDLPTQAQQEMTRPQQQEPEQQVTITAQQPVESQEEGSTNRGRAAQSAEPASPKISDRQALPGDRPGPELRSRQLAIVCNPWAYVFIDGDSIGVTPLEAPVEVAAGPHTILLKNPQFPPLRFSVTVDATTAESLHFSLWDHVAQVELNVTPWAEVFINGEKRDLAEGKRLLILLPGRHRLRFLHPALGEKQELIYLQAGERRTLQVNMF